MGRWSQYDTDEERLPEGMQRIGYDADSQTYTFRDADGSIWESAPGNRYGRLHRVSSAPYGDDEDSTEPPFPPVPAGPHASWRQEMMPLLNWFLLVGLFLLLVFWFISRRGRGGGHDLDVTCGDQSSLYTIRPGDTCWGIAEDKSLSLDALLRENQGLDCDRLEIGGKICVPNKT
ncbi:hypothetical protein F5X96DRAFT_507074 [Biscogniauxia mediterranea]|nr:hypothetical protein F5X96DRAFT_507074 [Biscogniauxia mediterranea]